MNNKRLGRGLSALIPTEDNISIQEIDINSININPNQPREAIDEKNIRELAESIKKKGILQPILVRRKDNEYEIIAGERRYQSAKLIGMNKVPVIVIDANDQEAYEISLIENIQREDLNPIEKARAFQSYIERYKVTHEELADKIGVSRSEITNILRLLQLPIEIQDEIKRGNLTYGHARALLGLEDSELQRRLARKVIKEKLSVRDTEALVKRSINKAEIPEIRMLEERLQSYLEAKVKIQPKSPDKGRITIEYKSLEELEKIVEKFLL
ncbi:MAG: ParB/RepB/Spo0J family partition protein [bacterium]|nr:ParB/RepB/Spo0J family partition protein [bacterium]